MTKGITFITGGNGFIGSHLVEYLLEQGVKPQNLRLLIPKKEEISLPIFNSLKIIRGDLLDKSLIKKSLSGVDVVYHLAALTIEGGKYFSKEEYQRVNVEGTKVLLESVIGKKIKKFVFFSSIAVFGLPAWKGNINNWSEKQEFDPQEPYGVSKTQAEIFVKTFCKQHKIPYAIIRPTSVYGPRDKRNLLELFLAIKKHLFLFIGDGKNKMDYVYVRDIVRAARLAQISSYKSSDYIIGGGSPISMEKVATTVANSMNIKLPHIYIPKKLALLISYFSLYTFKILGLKPILFPQRVKVLTTNCYYDISKAKNELGYTPKTSFKEGVQQTANWLKLQNLI